MHQFICPKCQHIGKPRRVKQGSGRVEVGMWLLFPLGLPYTFWRMLSKKNACANCGNDVLIDTESATGKTLLMRMDEKLVESIAPGYQPKPEPQAPKKEEKPKRVDDGW